MLLSLRFSMEFVCTTPPFCWREYSRPPFSSVPLCEMEMSGMGFNAKRRFPVHLHSDWGRHSFLFPQLTRFYFLFFPRLSSCLRRWKNPRSARFISCPIKQRMVIELPNVYTFWIAVNVVDVVVYTIHRVHVYIPLETFFPTLKEKSKMSQWWSEISLFFSRFFSSFFFPFSRRSMASWVYRGERACAVRSLECSSVE